MEREAVQEGRQLCLRHGGAVNASQFASHLYSVNPEFKKMFQGGVQAFCHRHPGDFDFATDRHNGSNQIVSLVRTQRRIRSEQKTRGNPGRAELSERHRVGPTAAAFWEFLCDRPHLKSDNRFALQDTFEQWLSRKCRLDAPTDNFTAIIKSLHYGSKLHTMGGQVIYGPRSLDRVDNGDDMGTTMPVDGTIPSHPEVLRASGVPSATVEASKTAESQHASSPVPIALWLARGLRDDRGCATIAAALAKEDCTTLAQVIEFDISEVEMKEDLGLTMRLRKLLKKAIDDVVTAAMDAGAKHPSDSFTSTEREANAQAIQAHWRTCNTAGADGPRNNVPCRSSQSPGSNASVSMKRVSGPQQSVVVAQPDILFQKTRVSVGIPADSDFDVGTRIRGPNGSFLAHVETVARGPVSLSSGEPLYIEIQSLDSDKLQTASELAMGLVGAVQKAYRVFTKNAATKNVILQLRHQLQQFKEKGAGADLRGQLLMSCQLTTTQRWHCHQIAEDLGLLHQSYADFIKLLSDFTFVRNLQKQRVFRNRLPLQCVGLRIGGIRVRQK